MSHHRIRTKSIGSSLREQWHVLWPVLAVLAVPLLLTALVIVKVFWSEHPRKLAADQDLHLSDAKLQIIGRTCSKRQFPGTACGLSSSEHRARMSMSQSQPAGSATANGARTVCTMVRLCAVAAAVP